MVWTSLFYLTKPFSITQRNFNAFHGVDRKLFTCLVINLGRDTSQSIQVMALWLWFERMGIYRKLAETLLSLPLGVTSALADEAVIVLRCIEQYHIPPPMENFEIHITRSFARYGISLRFLHHHRETVVVGVTRVINEVCSRAFKDILYKVHNPRNDMWSEPEPPQDEFSHHVTEWDQIWGPFNYNGLVLPPKEEFVYPAHEFRAYQSNSEFVPHMVRPTSTTRNNSSGSGIMPQNVRQNFMPNAANGMMHNNSPQNFVPNAASGILHNNIPQNFVPNNAAREMHNIPQHFAPNAARPMGPIWNQHPRQQQNYYTNMLMDENVPDHYPSAYEDNDITYQHEEHVVSNQLSDMFGNMNLAGFNELEMERDLVPEDDRTVFLTFSKGYPISETEVREYFTRRYGKCFDDIYMQDVGTEEQVLYARMVVKAVPIIYIILGGQPKAKFTINGKHVWARKYVRKGKEKEQGASSSQQHPNSPRSGTSVSG